MDQGETTAVRVREARGAIERLGLFSWRLICIGIVAWAGLNLLIALRLIVFPVIAALFLTVVLTPPLRWLRSKGWPQLAATWTVFLAFIGGLVLIAMLIVPALANGFADLGPTLAEGTEDVKTWFVEDSPFEVSRARVEEIEDQASERLQSLGGGSTGLVVHTAVLALEIVAGAILALVVTFFFLKDGERFQSWALRRIPKRHHDVTRRASGRGWSTIAGYLRGSALLGIFEAFVIGITLAITGAGLVIPVMLITFFAAFVPFVGAITAGVIAVVVAVATAGAGAALIVAVVALVVQQLDNDLLAPLVFGKALDLHPLIILFAVAAGGALAGIAGAFIAVPLTAVIINVSDEILKGKDSDEVPTSNA